MFLISLSPASAQVSFTDNEAAFSEPNLLLSALRAHPVAFPARRPLIRQ
jgi:hypothetical protein